MNALQHEMDNPLAQKLSALLTSISFGVTDWTDMHGRGLIHFNERVRYSRAGTERYRSKRTSGSSSQRWMWLSMLRQRVRQRQMHMPQQQMWLLLDENSVTNLNTYLNYKYKSYLKYYWLVSSSPSSSHSYPSI